MTIVKPLLYGNVARYFGKKREEDGHTHQWTVYVKPFLNEVLDLFLSRQGNDILIYIIYDFIY